MAITFVPDAGVMINGRYTRCQIRREDLHLVHKAVLHALGMEAWQEAEVYCKDNAYGFNKVSVTAKLFLIFDP